jgi:hypothetical protein
MERTIGGGEREPAARRGVERGHVNALAQGCLERGCIPLQMADDVVSRHEAIGILAGVSPAGELHRPVRGD